MNISFIGGIALATWILISGVIGSTPKSSAFLNSHAILLVIGGTIAAALISIPLSQVRSLIRLVIWGGIFKQHNSRIEIVKDIISAAIYATKSERTHLRTRTSVHPFLKEGYFLLAEGHIRKRDLLEILKLRSQYFKRAYLEDAQAVAALAKFPPAFGLLGAATGMITMMSDLGTGGQEVIGAAMAHALVATFWGVGLANFLLLPLADYAQRLVNEDTAVRHLIVEGLMQIDKGSNPFYVAERINSFLPPGDRSNRDYMQWLKKVTDEWKSYVTSSQQPLKDKKAA